MADLGCDYSDARPGGAALKAAGVVAAGRYLGNDSRCITPTEYKDLTDYSVGVWLVKESQTADLSVSMLNGYNKGVADALAAEAAIKQVGLPAGSPVSWAADFDIGPGSPRIAQAESYVDGWNTIIPAGRRMGYGGLWFLNYIKSRGKVDLLWECASTSFRHGLDPANVPVHIRQTTETPPVPGTDHNLIYDLTSLAGGNATPIQEEDDDVITVYSAPNRGKFAAAGGFYFPIDNNDGIDGAAKVDAFSAAGAKGVALTTAEWDILNTIYRRYQGDFEKGVAALVKIPAAVAAPAVPAVDVNALAKAIVALLPQNGQPATAEQIADVLAARLAS